MNWSFTLGSKEISIALNWSGCQPVTVPWGTGGSCTARVPFASFFQYLGTFCSLYELG